MNIVVLAEALYRIGAVRIGRFKLTSGIESPFYIDLRVSITHPEVYTAIVKGLIDLLSGLKFDVVAGIETAGIPWASMVAYELKKGLVYVRKEAKGHGMQRLVEGDVKEGLKAVLIDDVITTGSSLRKAVESLKACGVEIVAIAVIVDREQGGSEMLRRLGLRVLSLIRVSELFKALLNRGLITQETYDEVMRHISEVRV